MRIGSISQGKTVCSKCGKSVPYAGRYLIIREKHGAENEAGEPKIYCVACAKDKKYVVTRTEKGDTVITFFQDSDKPKARRIVEDKPAEEAEDKIADEPEAAAASKEDSEDEDTEE